MNGYVANQSPYYVDYYGPAVRPSTQGWAPWIDTTYYSAPVVWTDEEVKLNVEDNIDANPYLTRYAKNNLEVVVNKGIVTLKGTVRNKKDKFLAYADAFWSSGVMDVDSMIKVKEPKRKEE